MGCDIHMVLERKLKTETREEWASVQTFCLVNDNGLMDKFEAHRHSYYRVESRNYAFFGALTKGCVRGDEDPELGVIPRGFPDDPSIVAEAMYAAWGDDAHSTSWMYADEFIPVYMKYVMTPDESARYVTNRIEHQAVIWSDILEDHFNVGVSSTSLPSDFRFIYWFDN